MAYRRSRFALVCFLGATLGVEACNDSHPSAVPAPVNEVAVNDLNLLFIILDAAGARHFGCYCGR